MDDKLIAELRDHVRYRYMPAACRSAMEKAADALEAVRLQALEGAWRPIATAPKDGARVWLIQMTPGDYESQQCGGRFVEYSGERLEPHPTVAAAFVRVPWQTAVWACDLDGLWPTHWMPLPDPPRDEPIDGDRSRETKPILPKPIEGRGP